MDQVEVLIHKHKIKDKNILNILKHLNNVSDLNNLLNSNKTYCHSAIDLKNNFKSLSTSKGGSIDKQFFKQNTQDGSRRKFFSKASSLEKEMEDGEGFENIQELEHIMKLFRADQLYAPVIKHFSKVTLNYRRNFFVNLRFMAKMAPFRKLKNTVEKRRIKNLRDGFSSIVFYMRPQLKFLLLVYVISKAKQRNILDSFRRLEGYNKSKFKVKDFTKKNINQNEKNLVKQEPVIEVRRRDFIENMKGKTFSSNLSSRSMQTDYSPLKSDNDVNNLVKILSQYSSGQSLMNLESSKNQSQKRESVVFNFLRQLKNLQSQDKLMNFEYGYHFMNQPKQFKSLNKFGVSEEKTDETFKTLKNEEQVEEVIEVISPTNNEESEDEELERERERECKYEMNIEDLSNHNFIHESQKSSSTIPIY
jgi:hypothetical protein